MPQLINIEGHPCQLIRKPNRHMYIRVSKTTGEICITAPLAMPLADILAIANSRLSWIRKQLASIQYDLHNPMQEIAVWGEWKKVYFTPGKKLIQPREAGVEVALPFQPTLAQWMPILRQWQKEQVAGAALPLMEKWQRKLALPSLSLKVRFLKRSWGNCRPHQRRITLASRLAEKQAACLEYILIHELCHMLVPNHGPDFQHLIARYCPEWRALDELLVD